ncbi:hypothetical protein AMK16_02090 [Streptomyces sp. CB00455]|nr:hypothetical protein AMK16_02090 [Streptomyces sp. CB00455]
MAGEFDLDTLGSLQAALDAGENAGAERVVVDVTRVTFADSSVLNLLLGAHRALPLVLAGPLPDRLAHVLEVTCTDRVFTVAGTLAEARTVPLPPRP